MLDAFESRIRDRIDDIRAQALCSWCKNSVHRIQRRQLCSHCYEWDKEQKRHAKKVREIESKFPVDAFALSSAKRDLRIAALAVELCKNEGEVTENRLEQVDVTELHDEFDVLSRRLLGPKRGASIFAGQTHLFYDFSPTQRVWLMHLLSKITDELVRKDRRTIARNAYTEETHQLHAQLNQESQPT